MTYLCITCSKIFSTKSNLNRHIKIVHLKERNFSCDQCNKSFGLSQHLQTHIKTIHLKECNFRCDYCKKLFGENGSLQKHVKTVHLKERNFKCDYCEKSFGENGSLQRHIKNIHLNPKPKSMSRLEQKVFNILTELNIPFERELTFDDLRGINNGYLRFDFVISTNEQSISPYLIIEVDGQQHERPVTFGHLTDDEAIDQFEITQRHDEIKNMYCVENGYPLLRLKIANYKRFEELIDEFLKKYYFY